MDDNYIGFEVNSISSSCQCEHCGENIKRIKDYKVTYPTVGRINDRIVVLKLKRKMYYCTSCFRSTLDSILDIEKNNQKSNEFIALFTSELKEITTYSCIARRYKISPTNVIFHFDKISLKTYDYQTTKSISVDELRLVKGLGAYQCIITDNDTNQIIDILPNRLLPDITSYLQRRFDNLESAVIDCWANYRLALKHCYRNLDIIVDKFHIVRHITWAFNNTRIDLQKKKGVKIGKHWRLLSKRYKKLDFNGRNKVRGILNEYPDLKHAYLAKEYYFKMMDNDNINQYYKEVNGFIHYIHKTN